MNVDPRRYPNVNIRALETDDDVKAPATPNEDNTMLYPTVSYVSSFRADLHYYFPCCRYNHFSLVCLRGQLDISTLWPGGIRRNR